MPLSNETTYCFSYLLYKIARLLNYIAISRLKACSSNSLGDGPASFKCHREARGMPIIITVIVDELALPICNYSFHGPSTSNFKVGSMLTHINEFCVLTTSDILMGLLLRREIISLSYVNSLEEWQAVKASETKQQNQQRYRKKRDSSSSDNVLEVAAARPHNLSKEQLSINRHGFYAKGIY